MSETKTYKVTARIQIQDGTTSHIKRFKDEIEHTGDIGDVAFELKILGAFAEEIKNPLAQTTLTQHDDDGKEPQSLGAALKADEKKKPGRKPKEKESVAGGAEPE